MHILPFLFNEYLNKYNIESTVPGARGKSRDTQITKGRSLLSGKKITDSFSRAAESISEKAAVSVPEIRRWIGSKVRAGS